MATNDPRTDPTIGMTPDSTLTRLSTGAPADALPVLEDLVKTLGDRYTGLRRLGRGGMGEVFLARDPALKRNIAIKVLAGEYAADAAARARFVREAQAAAAVAHPNVVSIYLVGELNETRAPYFAMQYVEGNTLDDEYPAGRTATEDAARRIIAEVASALASAHAHGLVHRDIKPSNIMLDPRTGRAIVLDFGISASVSDLARADDRLTAAGAYIGTPRYMSPEQSAGHDATEKSDIYSLGCVAFEILTGRPVFTAGTVLELFASHLKDEAPAVSSLRPAVDPELNALVARCLEKDPAKRPVAIEIVQRLSHGAGVLLEWPPPGLESLRGSLPRLTRFFAIGSAITYVSLFVLLAAGGRMPYVSSYVALFALAGVVVLLEGCRRAFMLGRSMARAVRSGFGWMTTLEVAADADGETGDLISGSRRFGGVRAQWRSMLRTRRVLRAGVLMLAALSPVPALLAVIARSATRGADAGVIWDSLLIPFALLWIARYVRRRERQLAPVREASRSRTERDANAAVVPEWYRSFESARSGQQLGAGRARAAYAGLAGGTAALALVALIACITVPFVVVTNFSGVVWSLMLPNFETAHTRISAVQPWRDFAVPRDSSIKPVDAGRAFFALLAAAPAAPGFAETTVDHIPFPWDSARAPAGAFQSAAPDKSFPVAPSPALVLSAVARGTSREELAYLERIAHDRVWRTVDTVAKARDADFIGGRFVVPFGEKAAAYELPNTALARVRSIAYASTLRAAYYLAAGRRDSAETAIRTSMSFGFTLLESPSLIDALIGASMITVSRDAMLQYYTVTNDPRAARLKARIDSANAQVASGDAAKTGAGRALSAGVADVRDPQRARVLVRSLVLDQTLPRAVRFELLRALAFTPCTNPGELVFGQAADVKSAFDYASRTIARYPSEQSLVELLRATADRMPPEYYTGFVPRAIVGASSIAGTVLRNQRLRACTQLVLGIHAL